MSTTIDRRVVEARFDNKQFQSGVKGTLDSLSELKSGLKMDGAVKGLSEVDDAAKRLSFQGLGQSVDNLASKFSALRVAGVAALTAIILKVGHAATNLAKQFTIKPITDGLAEYETNLNSIQTILSNTKWEDKTLEDVNNALGELNEYADLTIYNFAEMARNIGTFTAAGVELDTSVGAIKGIANLAAVSGSNAQQASTAMYQLSQALSSGTVRLMDWNSVQNAGLGGKVFQDAIKETARAHGVAIDEIIEDTGSFRESLQEGWFSAEILTDTLNTFTGDLTDAQLLQMGYTEEQIKGIQEMAATAVSAATEVKTFTQLIDTVQEAIGTGWADTFALVLGDFEEAKALWTSVNNAIGAFVDENADARNSVLTDWKDLGGREALIDGMSNAFKSLFSVLEPLRGAFREIFPAKTGAELYELTVRFRDFFERFKIGGERTDQLKRTFKGLFAIFGIGVEIIKAVGRVFYNVVESITAGSGGILEFTAGVGDFLTALYEAVKTGEGFSDFFDGLDGVLQRIIGKIKEFAGWVADLFGEFEVGTETLDPLLERFDTVEDLGDKVAEAWGKVVDVFSNAKRVVTPMIEEVIGFFSNLGGHISDAISNLDINYDQVLSTINTGLFAALVGAVRSAISGRGGDDDDSPGFIDAITGPFRQLTDTLETMQNTLRATTLLQIAAAVGILAASVVALSTVDSENLAKALTAMTAMFLQLFGALAAFQAIGGVGGLSAAGFGLILVATALRILVESAEDLSELDWDEVQRGLTGVTALIAGLVAATLGISGHAGGMVTAGLGLLALSAGIKVLGTVVSDLSDLDWEGMGRGLTGVAGLIAGLSLFTNIADLSTSGIKSGAGLVLVAGAVVILARATEDLGSMNWEEVGRGLAAVSGLLAAFAAFSNLVNPTGVIQTGISLAIVGGAMLLLADGVEKFGDLSWEEIGKGLAAMSGALFAISAALNLMPPTTLASAAALIVVSGALLVIADAMGEMGGMEWGEIGKGLTALAGGLLIIAVAVNAMTTALPGAIALAVVAGALTLLVPVLTTLGDMTWGEIGRGLTALAGAFLVLGAAGLIILPVVPVLLALGAAISLIGLGIGAAGVGIGVLALGLTTLAAAGTAAGAVVTLIVKNLIELLPFLAEKLGDAVVVFAEVIGESAPAILDAMSAILESMLGAIEENIPLAIDMFTELALSLLEALEKLVPQMIDTGFALLENLLEALNEKAPDVVQSLIDLGVAMIETLTDNIDEMAAAGTALIVAFIDSIADNIGDVITAGTNLIIAIIEGIGDASLQIVRAAAETILTFLEGIATSITLYSARFREAGLDIAYAIVDGMTFGILSKVGSVISAARSMANSAIEAASNALDTGSPSKEFIKIGEFVGEGFAEGIVGSRESVVAAWTTTTDLIRSAMASAKKDVDTLQDRLSRLEKARDKDRDKIRETKAELAQANFEYDKTFHLLRQMKGMYDDERRALYRLGNQYSSLTGRIEEANDRYKDAIQTRNDYNRTVADRVSDLPDVARRSSAERYINDLKKANSETFEFTKVLQQLRRRGLGDDIYKELLDSGPSALRFAKSLLEGGEASIDEVNKLSNKLSFQAKKLGRIGSRQLYQAGVNSARGLVRGLASQRKGVEDQMSKIASYLVSTLKKKLGISSPSRETQILGEFVADGLVKGLTDGGKAVGKAAEALGDEALSTMGKTIENLSEAFKMGVDTDPVITPVIDMTEIRRGASAISSAIGTPTVDIGTSFSKARLAARQASDSTAVRQEPPVERRVSNFEYTQINQSPKAIPPAEIYRHTKGQLATVKEALDNAS